jgi:hypothetical protein
MRNIYKKILFLAIASAAITLPITSQARNDGSGRGDQRYERGHRDSRIEHKNPHYDARRHYQQKHYYYPPYGHVVHRLPPRHQIVLHRDIRYHYHYATGVWYRPQGVSYIVTSAPRGAIVRVLPSPYVVFRAYGRPYYYVNNVYYVPSPQGYVVSEPPPLAAIESREMVGENDIIEEPVTEEAE